MVNRGGKFSFPRLIVFCLLLSSLLYSLGFNICLATCLSLGFGVARRFHQQSTDSMKDETNVDKSYDVPWKEESICWDIILLVSGFFFLIPDEISFIIWNSILYY